MKEAKRSQLLVDRQVQGRLLSRVLLYWFMALMVMGGMAALQVNVESRHAPLAVVMNRTLLAFGPALIASVALLPLIAFDALRFSNRFAGPMHRLRREVKRLADGKSFDMIHFREGDYWYDLAQEFNRLAERLERLESAATKTNDKSREETPAIAAAT